MCEEFACTPSQAAQELEEDPDTVFEILKLRAYANAKQAYDHACKHEPKSVMELLSHPTVQQVQETEFVIAQAALEEARGGSVQG